MSEQLQIEHGTILGRDGYLFLADGAHTPMEYMRGEGQITSQSLSNFQRNILRRQRVVQKYGAKYQHFVAPDKHVVLSAAVPMDGVMSLAQEYRDRTAAPFNFPVESLRAGPSYWQTDTHWSPHGRIIAARELARGFGLATDRVEKTLADIGANCFIDDGEFSGDLGRRFDPPKVEVKTVFKPDWEFAWFDNGVGSNDGVCVAIYSHHKTAEGRLLIFGDSFMMETISTLSALFKEILFCRTRYFHQEIVLQADADYVLTQNVERYLSGVDTDANAPPFLMMPQVLGRSTKYVGESARAIAALLSRRERFYHKFVGTLPNYVPLEARTIG